jgi:hypothetical protein
MVVAPRRTRCAGVGDGCGKEETRAEVLPSWSPLLSARTDGFRGFGFLTV